MVPHRPHSANPWSLGFLVNCPYLGQTFDLMCVHANEERRTNLTFVNKTSENVPKEAGTKLPSDLFVKTDISINVWD